MASGLIRAKIPETAVHLCIDMQRMFAEDTAWKTPWMERVLPVVVALCEHKAERTRFTRFVPAAKVGEGEGTWRDYRARWPEMTTDRLGRERVDLIPALAAFVPPARVLDKRTYSPWIGTGLDQELRRGRRRYACRYRSGDRCLCTCRRTGGRRSRLSSGRRHGRPLQLRRRDPRCAYHALQGSVRPADRNGRERRGSGELGLTSGRRRAVQRSRRISAANVGASRFLAGRGSSGFC